MGRHLIALTGALALAVAACGSGTAGDDAPTVQMLVGAGSDRVVTNDEDVEWGDFADLDVMRDGSVLVATIGPNQIVRIDGSTASVFAGGADLEPSEQDPCGIGEGVPATEAEIGLVSEIEVTAGQVFITDEVNCTIATDRKLRRIARRITDSGIITTVLPAEQVRGDIVSVTGTSKDHFFWVESGDQKVVTTGAIDERGAYTGDPTFLAVGPPEVTSSEARAAYNVPAGEVIDRIAANHEVFFTTHAAGVTGGQPPSSLYGMVRDTEADTWLLKDTTEIPTVAADDAVEAGYISDLVIDSGRRVWALDTTNHHILFWKDPFSDEPPERFGGSSPLHDNPTLADAELGGVGAIAINYDASVLYLMTPVRIFKVNVPAPPFEPPVKTPAIPLQVPSVSDGDR